MKVFILLSIFAASHAATLLASPVLLSSGGSTQYKSQDSFGNYAFGYDERHTTGGTFRKESSDAFGNKIGSYGLRDADGRIRIVNYIADAAGFRADIKTNEPGVEPKDPANTAINKATIFAQPAAHTFTYAAPTTHAITYAAPATHAVTYKAPATPIAYSAHPLTYAARPFTYAHTFPYAHGSYYHL